MDFNHTAAFEDPNFKNQAMRGWVIDDSTNFSGPFSGGPNKPQFSCVAAEQGGLI